MSTMPPPPGHHKLADEELDAIFKATLTMRHQADHSVLKYISSYISCRSSAQASREAAIPGVRGYYLLNKPDVHECIRLITAKQLNKYGFTANEVIERVKEIADMDLACFENPDGSYKTRLSEVPPEARRAIRSIKLKNSYGTDPNGMPVKTGEIVEITLWDKMKSLELLGREKAIFTETTVVKHDITDNMGTLLLDSNARAQARIEALRDTTPPQETVLEITARAPDSERDKTPST